MTLEEWLDERIFTSELLERALNLVPSGSHNRVEVLDGLATELGFKVDRLGESGYFVLEWLAELFQEQMKLGPGSWVDADSEWHVRLAEKASAKLHLGHILKACSQFGWQGAPLSASNPKVDDVNGLVRQVFVTRLSQRIFTTFERWRKHNVWPAIPRFPESGLRETA